ncbi:phytoene/squalene synthase family protein [Altericista sp. CCNU0014]|uniref:phytoene/squalene synthase family protein n=1 Tax=Altericista sp. CCNU0014 TaxID=3082949 RepID=UPI00384B253A
MVQIALESPLDRRDVNRFCQEILPQVSRTFALSIRFLPGQLGRAVLCGYLLARIADTIEDDPKASVAAKSALLDQLVDCFEDSSLADRYAQHTQSVTGDPAHLELVHQTHQVFTLYRSLPLQSQQTLQRWLTEMIVGMKKFVNLYPNGIRIKTLEEYKEYCYYVAGTVGYLLTDLWYEHSPFVSQENYELLRKTCAEFGEALQTVNILKDIAWDAEHENSIYIPQDALQAHGSSHETLLDPSHLEQNHAAIKSLVELAWTDLDKSTDYLTALPHGSIAIRLFCILPLVFAYATLRDITRSTAMLTSGGNVKITRSEVKALIIISPLTAIANGLVRSLIQSVRQRAFCLWF